MPNGGISGSSPGSGLSAHDNKADIGLAVCFSPHAGRPSSLGRHPKAGIAGICADDRKVGRSGQSASTSEMAVSCQSFTSRLCGSFAQHFSHCRRAIIHPEADASRNLRRPSAANVKLNGPQTGRVQGIFEWQLKHWVAVVWIEATSPSSCSRLYRECDRPRITPKIAGTTPS